MTDVRALPFPEFPDESPESRTRRLIATRPDLLDHIAYNYWRDEKGAPNTPVERNAWTDMPHEVKEEWKHKALHACEEYWNASTAERTMMSRASLARELDRNAARADMPRLPGEET